MSSLLPDPDGSQAGSTAPTENTPNAVLGTRTDGLTYKQQLKQDAMLWAEFLYGEYQREKALREEARTMPTHYDNSDA